MTFPNFLSIVRILLSPVFIILFSSEDFLFKKIGFLIFFIAVITDWYDGWHARKYKSITNFGIFIDPLADKILTSSAFYYFYVSGIMPFWMLAIILMRDLLVTLLRSYDEYKGFTMKTTYIAKVKTFLQMSYIFLVLLLILALYSENFQDFKASIYYFLYNSILNYFIMLIVSLITLYTGLDYLIRKKITKYETDKN